MNLDETKYELIQKYLDNELSESEKVDFEQQLADNETLANEVKLFQLLPTYIGEGQGPEPILETDNPKYKAYLKEILSEESKGLAAQLETIGSEYISTSETEETTTLKSTGSKWRVLKIAAAIVILIGGTWIFRPQPSPSKLYSTYVNHEAIILNQRGEASVSAKEAEQKFNEGNYGEAIPLLQAISEQEINYDVVLALGIAYLEQDDFANAMEQFKTISNSDAIIKDKALWYQAAAYLKIKDKEKALESLQLLQKEYPYFKTEETAALIKKLK